MNSVQEIRFEAFDKDIDSDDFLGRCVFCTLFCCWLISTYYCYSGLVSIAHCHALKGSKGDTFSLCILSEIQKIEQEHLKKFTGDLQHGTYVCF